MNYNHEVQFSHKFNLRAYFSICLRTPDELPESPQGAMPHRLLTTTLGRKTSRNPELEIPTRLNPEPKTLSPM